MITLFKRKKEEKNKEKVKKTKEPKPRKKVKEGKKKRERREELKLKEKKDLKPRIKAKGKVESWRWIIKPIISEKSTFLEEENKYVFQVANNANKIEVKKAIEDIYGVKVEKVNIINKKRKKRRLGRYEGYRPGYKKAIVKLKQGSKIELVPK